MDLPSEHDTKTDYDTDQKVDSQVERKDETDYNEQKLDCSASSANLKMECKKSNRPSRSRKRLYTSTRCLRSSQSLCNKRQKQLRTSATSKRAGNFPVSLEDIFTKAPRTCSSGSKRKPKPKEKPEKRKDKDRKRKSKKKKCAKVSSDSDVEHESDRHEETPVVAENTQPMTSNIETKDSEHEETPVVAENTQPMTSDIETKDSEHEETPDVVDKEQLTNDTETKDSEHDKTPHVGEQQENDTEKEDKNNVAEETKLQMTLKQNRMKVTTMMAGKQNQQL